MVSSMGKWNNGSWVWGDLGIQVVNRMRFVDNLCALHVLLLPRVLSLDKANEF